MMQRTQDLRIERSRCLCFTIRFRLRISTEKIVVGNSHAVAINPRTQHGKDTSFPIDQGTIAIECQGTEVFGVEQIGFLELVTQTEFAMLTSAPPEGWDGTPFSEEVNPPFGYCLKTLP